MLAIQKVTQVSMTHASYLSNRKPDFFVGHCELIVGFFAVFPYLTFCLVSHDSFGCYGPLLENDGTRRLASHWLGLFRIASRTICCPNRYATRGNHQKEHCELQATAENVGLLL